MSLFSSLNLARLSLAAHQSAIQTVGQNIANASTEGYARQRVQMQPTPANDLVYARVGTGVRIDRIERIVDQHLESTLRNARSGLGLLAEQDRLYSLLGSVFNDLDGGGLSQALGRFFESLEDLSNTPEDPTARHMVLEEAQTLVESFHYLDARVRDVRSGIDQDIVGAVNDVNRMLGELAQLNTEITVAEDGGVHPGTANDLRTRRDLLLGQLSDLIDVKAIENDRGAIQVISGSDVLVYGNRANTIDATQLSDGDISMHEFRLSDDGKRFSPVGGRLGALLAGRDQLTTGLRDDLDVVAQGFLQAFNEIHAGGEGLERLTSIASPYSVGDRTAPLSDAGYPYPIEDGSFTFQVVNEADGTRESYRIDIDLDGTSDDTTLLDVVEHINTVIAADHPEISASVTGDGYVRINSSDSSLTFTFRDDDSGFLTAAGLNTFFQGTNARDIEIAAHVLANSNHIVTGLGDGPGDNSAIQNMLLLRDEGVLGSSGVTFEEYYTAMIGRVGVEGAETADLLRNQQAIVDNVTNQREALSGVNIDEEAILLIKYQRAYQGSARFLNVVDRLLDTLINSV